MYRKILLDPQQASGGFFLFRRKYYSLMDDKISFGKMSQMRAVSAASPPQEKEPTIAFIIKIFFKLSI